VTLEVDEPAGRPDAPILLVTKLHPPFVPTQTIARDRLFERLRGGKGSRLTLVACPAGFGKSTLLAAWRERELLERPVAWVTLDEADNDAVVLWSYVIDALGRACPGLDRETLGALVGAAPMLEVVLPRLVNELVDQGDVVLVLDDFHRLSSDAARASVAWFVEYLPSTVQLVLATRTDPAMPLGTLRARGQLLELRANELRFTDAEADEFLNGAVVTTVAGAGRLGGGARGLVPWAGTQLEAAGRPTIEVTATPCRHGPPLSHPIIGDVIGFALRWEGQEHGVLWISGDTVLYDGVHEVADRLRVDTAILHLGGVQFPVTGPVRYTMTARDAVEL
jgi:hypothetical protein